MANKTSVERLSELTERQLDILRRFCDGQDYKTIADELFLATGTVRVHMGNIYETLELGVYPVEKRRQLLFQVYCPALRGEEIAPAPTESDEPKSVPDRVMKMVEEDENALVIYHPKPLVPDDKTGQTIIMPSPQPPRRGCRTLIIGIIIGIALAAIGGFMAWIFLDGNGPPAPTAATEEMPAETSALEPAPPTQPPTVEEVIVVVTATPKPATATPRGPTNTAKPTESPNTPPGTRLKVGDTWKQDGFHLTLSEVRFLEFQGEGEVWLTFMIANHTGATISVALDKFNVTLETNTGSRFRPFYNDPNRAIWQGTLNHGDRFTVVFDGAQTISWLGDYFSPDVSYILVTVRDWSRISEAMWQIDIEH